MHLDLERKSMADVRGRVSRRNRVETVRLHHFVRHVELTDTARFLVIGGFRIDLDGGFVFDHDTPDWIVLRASTSASTTELEESARALACACALSAWRRLRYDMDSEEEAVRAHAACQGVATHEHASYGYHTRDVAILELDVARRVFRLDRDGEYVTVSNARRLLSFLFSNDELTRARNAADSADATDDSWLSSGRPTPHSWELEVARMSNLSKATNAAADDVEDNLDLLKEPSYVAMRTAVDRVVTSSRWALERIVGAVREEAACRTLFARLCLDTPVALDAVLTILAVGR
jgi:hypothetical protein